VGWAKQEFAALSVPFERRGALTNQYLEAILQCWTDDARPLRKPHPPIWVGGSSAAAIRRAVRYGDAWHPIRFRLDWIEQDGLPLLRRMADEEGKPAPAFCPRLKVQSPDQARADIETLARLGATHILLDTYTGNPKDTLHAEKDWELLARLLAN
jgi:alkanesulfonate monooxygenase SsuD/methylene tetrahydromethanopterin reductase-like flavin-dependent oxidoreductase (luciferase family)